MATCGRRTHERHLPPQAGLAVRVQSADACGASRMRGKHGWRAAGAVAACVPGDKWLRGANPTAGGGVRGEATHAGPSVPCAARIPECGAARPPRLVPAACLSAQGGAPPGKCAAGSKAALTRRCASAWIVPRSSRRPQCEERAAITPSTYPTSRQPPGGAPEHARAAACSGRWPGPPGLWRRQCSAHPQHRGAPRPPGAAAAARHRVPSRCGSPGAPGHAHWRAAGP